MDLGTLMLAHLYKTIPLPKISSNSLIEFCDKSIYDTKLYILAGIVKSFPKSVGYMKINFIPSYVVIDLDNRNRIDE